MEMYAAQTPLLELLKGVPADARVIYEHGPTHHQSIPCGRLCAEAVTELERMRNVLERMTAWYSSVDDTTTTQREIDEMRTRARAVLGYGPNVL